MDQAIGIRLKTKIAIESLTQQYTAEHGAREESDAEVKRLQAQKTRSTIGYALGITGAAVISAAITTLVFILKH